MAFKEFAKELNGSRVEGQLIKTVFYSLLVSFGFLALVYFFKFKGVEGFVSDYGYYLLFSALSIALVMLPLRQLRAYKEMPCMGGMMVGMTIGMISGFLLGFFTASTNGMFYGGFYGVIIGMITGIWLGKCCGIMGIMEGMMAGFMGGLMGAMTSFMLLNDPNLKIAGIICFVISAAIMFGLNYMIYTEMKEMREHRKDGDGFVAIVTFILIALTTWLIVYGPRSALFG